MSISVSGLGSGLNYDTWIQQLVAIKQADIDKVSSQVNTVKTKENTLSTIKGNYSDLLTAIQSFTKALASDSVFKQKAVSSSSEAITAKVNSSANVQNLTVSVDKLATATVAKSTSAAASYADEDTLISNISEGTIKEGDFSVYVGGTKHTISITSGQTLGSVITSLKQIAGVDASISNGKLTITKSGAANVTVGSSSDTSNFTNVMSLVRDVDTGVYSSSKSAFETNTSAVLTQTPFAKGKVTAGTFTIGNDEFTIDENTTLDSLIYKINTSEDAGVTAYWDSNAGKLVLTANEEGAVNINIQAGTSNFTDIMGLTQSTWKEDGSIDTSDLVAASQELGTNAILTINGTPITSTSNTVTSDISGIEGLTLTLNDKTTTTAKIAVTTDNSAASKAISSFVDTFNTVISNTNTATGSDGNLYGESILTMIKNSLRSAATASVSTDGSYKNLAGIGITTGAFTTDTTANTNKLVIDKDKLTTALETNPEAVMKLLVGDTSTGSEGVLSKLDKILTGSLDPTKGYFVKREDSFESEADRLNDKVDSMNLALKSYKSQLEAKFQAMDTLISNLQHSASIFDSYFNKNNSSSSNSSSNPLNG